MKEQWLVWGEKFGELQQREKVMTLFVGLFLIVYLLAWFVIAPLHTEMANNRKANVKTAQQLATQEQQIAMLTEALKRDYTAELRQQITTKKLQLESLSEQLHAFRSAFIPPREMAQLLQKLLNEHSTLAVTEFKLKNAKPIHIGQEEGQAKVAFYQHDLNFAIEGNFFDLLAYVKQINALEERVFIHDFDYQVLEYPKARLSLTIATISADEKAIQL